MHRIHLITAATFAALMATTTLSQAQSAAPAGQPAETAQAAEASEPAAPAAAPARTGDIRSIVLFSGGVAEIVRSASVSGEATVGMEVPLDQVNDVLKSLVVRNPGGTVGQVSLEGSVNARELSRAALFSPADLGSLGLLLNKMKGAKVRIEGNRSVTGTVLGTSQPPEAAGDDKAETPVAIVTLLAETGEVRSMPVFSDTALEILDEKTADELRKTAASLAQSLSDDTRLVSVKVDGSGERQVEFDYVVAAPVWKSSHRLVLSKDGQGRLQSWAVIENATGENWSDVKVSLSSGSPVTLRQNLFDPYFRERPEVPVFVDRQSIPDADRGEVPSAPPMAAKAQRGMGGAAAFADNLMAAAPQPEAFAMGEAGEVGEAVEGDVSVTYPLPRPVTLDAGSTLSVPIVDADVPAERIAVFTPGRGEIHPTAAVRLDNETGSALPAGIVTVYDASGYVGDSTLLPVPAGDERQVQFALDRKITVNTTERPEDRITELRVVDGVLRYKQVQERQTIYSAANAGTEDRKLSIAHPKMSGWELTSEDRAGETESAYRLEATVPAGGTRDIRATARFVTDEGFALVDAGQSDLVRFSKQTDDPKIASALENLAAIQGEKATLDRQIERLEAEKADIFAAQDRIRENIKAVGPGDLRDGYLGTMAKQEDRLAAIDAEVAALKTQREAVEARLRETIAAI
ncbi:DUF4139 domain-containing protein [Aurantimonas sp. 22II-16-19i]|uniref:DUF4139 domain-containing protein n=1 Tax=Aurantimonas sp. 22II-16-19i TaxID=1317114 RepID=UPI0009F7A958|nr:DUF4139 domain-containing protein [Aurantimonas sp. 22II-16-19i]ORE89678.1 hypothetical protein ATO4_24187 [Aurantimonas sp. 22II-16-19i]